MDPCPTPFARMPLTCMCHAGLQTSQHSVRFVAGALSVGTAAPSADATCPCDCLGPLPGHRPPTPRLQEQPALQQRPLIHDAPVLHPLLDDLLQPVPRLLNLCSKGRALPRLGCWLRSTTAPRPPCLLGHAAGRSAMRLGEADAVADAARAPCVRCWGHAALVRAAMLDALRAGWNYPGIICVCINSCRLFARLPLGCV